MRLQSILGLGSACKLETYQADRSLNPPPLSRHSSNPHGHATASGARIPCGKASVASRFLVYLSAQVAQSECSRSDSRLTDTPGLVGAGDFRSSSRHPAGRHTPPWKLVLEGVQAMSSGSHPWTSQTLATGLLPFLPGWALRRVWPGRSVAAEVVPRGHVHVCV